MSELMRLKGQRGFSLVELLVAILITGIASTGLYMVFGAQSRAFIKQEQTIEVQQSARSGLEVMAHDIRMAFFDPQSTDDFDVFEVFPRDLNNNPSAGGWGAITIMSDINRNGGVDNNETIRYSLFDSPTISPGVLDVARQEGVGARQPMVSDAEGLAFAFAFDSNDDRQVEQSAGGNILWAIDSDADNSLDLILDTNDDGVIDINDDPLGTALATPVGVANIRAVRIWLLVRSGRMERNMLDNGTYVVGNRRVIPAGDNRFYQRRLLSEVVWLRNAGLGAF